MAKKPPEFDGKIIERPMEELLHDSMMPYAEYVIMDRAIPRVEDGLKPVQRRILHTMYELSLLPDKPHRKSARIVGDCLGKYHPHGDTSVYDAMVRMAQDFNMSAPLVDGHGNFGSVDGDSAAAMRYTEARMTPLAMELLRDIDKDTVSFSLNFDDTLKEPDMLPGRYPNLLVNGATGIAVGLATNIPPHNLGEAIDATVALMDKPTLTTVELMQYVKGPDFPTYGLMLGMEDIVNTYETGKGKVTMRAKSHVEEQKNGKHLLVITELPFQVNKATALEKILKLSEEKKNLFSGINDIRDESDRTGMRAVIELKKDGDAQKILQYLYKYSDLQVNFSFNMVAIAQGKPQLMGLRDILTHYIRHQKQVVTKRTQYDLDAALRRAHILEGLIIAVDNIDKVIKIIRSSQNIPEAKKRLMETFALSEIQAQAILDMRLQRLTGLSIIELKEEYAKIAKLIEHLQGILRDEKKLLALIKKELQEIKKKYAVPRRTQIIDESAFITIDASDLVNVEDVTVYMTPAGIKRMPQKVYAAKGAQEDGNVQFALHTQSDKRIHVFTNLGMMYALDVQDIPEPKGKDKGAIPAALIQGWQDSERILCAFQMPVRAKSFIFVTKQGLVKRTPAEQYVTRSKKFAACSLKQGDEVVSVLFDESISHLLLISKLGFSITFDAASVSPMGRVSTGVKGMGLGENDEVAFAFALPVDTELAGEILVLTDRGYAKRSLLCDYEPQNRGGKGIKTIDIKKNGATGIQIVFAAHVTEPKEMLITQKHGLSTKISTEEVVLAKQGSKGTPVLAVLMDDVIREVFLQA